MHVLLFALLQPALTLLVHPAARLAPSAARPRALAAVMWELPAPPAPPRIDTDHGYGGGDDSSLLLADVSIDERQAIATIWNAQYEMEAQWEAPWDEDVHKSHYLARWVGDFGPTGWFGRLKGRTLGAYFDTDLDKQPEALVALHYELDTSDWRRAAVGHHVLIVDEILLSPSVPERFRPLLHAALLNAVVELGRFHQMTVAFLDDFDI